MNLFKHFLSNQWVNTVKIKRPMMLVVAGLIHALSFAHGPWSSEWQSVVQILTLTVLGYSTRLASCSWTAIWQGWLFNLFSFGLGLYWIYISLHVYGHLAMPVAVLGVVLLAAFLAIFPALSCGLTYWLVIKPTLTTSPLFIALTWAASWTSFEVIRGTIFTGFPWLSIGYAHVDSVFSGWTPVLGVYGLGFTVAFTVSILSQIMPISVKRENTTSTIPTADFRLAYDSTSKKLNPQKFNKKKVRYIASMLLSLFALPSVGYLLTKIEWSHPAGKALSVRLVQGNIAQSEKFDPILFNQAIMRHLQLAALPIVAPKPTPKLILLPETVVPLFQDKIDPQVWQIWRSLARDLQATIVMGVPLHSWKGLNEHYTNSVIKISADTSITHLIAGEVIRYDKHHLVPFGEYVPLGFRWLTQAMRIPLGDFDQGAKYQPPFAIEDQRVAFNICYEDLFGQELLSAIRTGPQGEGGATILANLSNLGWFGNSWALPQHLQIARLRAQETARPIITATNTGITAAIDYRGTIITKLLPHQTGVLSAIVQGRSGLTPYACFGNILILIATGLFLLITVGLRGYRIIYRR